MNPVFSVAAASYALRQAQGPTRLSSSQAEGNRGAAQIAAPSFDVTQDRPFDVAQDRSFDFAQDR